MKIELILAFTIVVLLGGLSGSVSAQKYSGGTGEPNNPYRISDANDMNEIGANTGDWDKHFICVNDINLADYTGTSFNIIGNTSPGFTGVFDGNNHTISNFTYEPTDAINIGLFGILDSNAVIKDLTLTDVNVAVENGGWVGSLVGLLYSGTVCRCNVEGGSVSGRNMVGGLVGMVCIYGTVSTCQSRNVSALSRTVVSGNHVCIGGLVGANQGTVSACFSTSSVLKGDSCVGGLIGHNMGTVSRCYSAGSVSDVNQHAGGLVGYNHNLGTIENCYAKGVILCDGSVGGLIGGNAGTISYSYATGKVDGNDPNIGGLVGYDNPTYSTSYTKCFWDSNINPDVNGIGNITDPNVISELTAEMQKESTFVDVGWDFVEIWDIGENQTYPFLQVYPAGDLNHDGRVDFFDIAIVASHWLKGTEP